MKTNWKVSLVAIIATVMSMGATAAEKSFSIGGDAEYDITHRKQTSSANVTTKNFSETGRVKLNAKARIDHENGAFVEAVAQPLFSYTDGKSPGSDDMYIKFGKKAWDLQLGRFEGFDLFPLGKDTVANAAAEIDSNVFGYKANNARGRGPDGIVHGAFHSTMGKFQTETRMGFGENATTKTTHTRPAVKFDAGRFRFAVGYDLVQVKTKANGANTTTKGFGITAGTKIGAFDANINAASGKSNATGADKISSIGLNATRGRFGAGYIHDKNYTTALNTTGKGKQDTFYAAYSVPLMGSKDATVTFAASTSKAKYDAGGTAKDTSARVRFNYGF
ncbi:MAG: carbohydrate porin [Thiofilum sp.]|uniref:carbohydrate porin n=1 Tax=Thiofilum sp. TaxID=2212733 RepID=UPI0025D86041|nr:carbohydrate porin [Thiofilum sp.]MBK8453047.1 carbohydrate porin [Thiofilum sp.]